MPGYRLNHPCWTERQGTHIESFFLKANDLNSPRAVWIKVTCLQKQTARGVPPDCWLDLWCCVFDKPNNYYEGARHRLPLSSLDITDGVLSIDTPDISVSFGTHSGHFRTRIEDEGARIDVDLTWNADTSQLGEAYTSFPYSWMLQGPLPKQKTITPIGLCYVSGGVRCEGKHHQLQQWVGCQGHNWGRAHTPDYVWLHTVLTDASGVVGTCEAFSGSVKVGGTQLGPFSGLILRLRDKTYRFDRLIDTWNHQVDFAEGQYSLQLKRSQLRVELRATADLNQVVCLGYEDPDATMHFCMNSKLASASIQITEGEFTQTFQATDCVALEWLSTQPKARVI
jgi:hypothetical protein